MAVTFVTSDAKNLLKEFNARIDQTEKKGKIETWMKSDDGKYYTHTAKDWTKKAWFKPDAQDGKLVFNIIKPKSSNISTVTYGYYHGHLTETFLNHFDSDFTQAQSSAKPTSSDNVSA